MGYYASGSGDATIKEGKSEELKEGGTVVYSNNAYHFKETEGDGTYKVSQIEKHLDAAVLDEYYNAQLTGAGAKPINLDSNALKILKAYYSGKTIYIEEVA